MTVQGWTTDAMVATYGNLRTLIWGLPEDDKTPGNCAHYAEVENRIMSYFDRDLTINVTTLKGLTHTLERSEKKVLRAQGKHPRKDRTGNLINYIELLDDKEADLLVKLLQKKRPDIHLGMLAFVSRDYALETIYENTKGHIPRYSGYKADVIIADDITHKLDVKGVLNKNTASRIAAKAFRCAIKRS